MGWLQRVPSKARADAAAAWMRARYYRLVGAVLAVGVVVAGACFALSGWLSGARVSIDVASLERGGEPPGRYAEISGRLLLDEAVGVRSGKRGATTVTVYVPVVSQRWRRGQPVRVYLETYETWLDRYVEELASGRYEGMLGIGSLPGVAQTALTENGMPPPDRYWLLDYRMKPDAQITMGLSLLFSGGVLGAVTALAWVAIERRNRRRASRG